MFINSVSDLSVKKVTAFVRLLNSPVGIKSYRVNRERWGVALKLKGKTIYTVGDKKILSDALHPVILPKGSDYSWTCIEPGECIIVDFEADTTDSMVYSFELNYNNFLHNTLHKIEKSLAGKKPYYNLECKNYLYEILLYLLKTAKKDYTPPKKYTILKPAIKYITENYYDTTITNDFLAELCAISTVYFRKTFESVYGVSPIKYLNNYRINKAKSILHSDYESIEQVALSVGYNSIYHFSRMFKLYTGKTPSEYAKASRK